MADTISYDILIIGSGIAGLRAAISAANIDTKLRIAVISKVQVMRSHSAYYDGCTPKMEWYPVRFTRYAPVERHY